MGTMRDGHFDLTRIAVFTVLTAAVAVGSAEALLYQSSHAAHVGPTSAALSDGTSAIAGACLGLGVGALAAAACVRSGSRVASGLIVGVIAFLVGVAPYSWLTSPSDVGTGDNVGWLVILFIPAIILVTFGAVIGAAVRGPPNWTSPQAGDS